MKYAPPPFKNKRLKSPIKGNFDVNIKESDFTSIVDHKSSIQNKAIYNPMNIEKVKQQNIRLKEEMRLLLEALEQIQNTELVKKKEEQLTKEVDPEIKQKNKELNDQSNQITLMRKEISTLKKSLENTFELNRIIELENEIAQSQKFVSQLEEEKQSLQTINEEQSKALQSIKTDNDNSKRIEESEKQLTKIKEENRKLNEQILEKNSKLKQIHEQYIIKQSQILEMKKKISGRLVNVSLQITEDMLSNLTEKLEELQKQKSEIEQQFQNKLKNLEKQKRDIQKEANAKLMVLKEKEKEVKLNQIKIKEIQKLFHNAKSQEKSAKQSPVK